ncbi:ABC transporter ATP-binding protein [Actinophytocola oryzae]|uniref:NitT/TauT family transport system ATP-binding protein n=1 Tax=Actinophytocola oryzae TaxID=502181 RepID=A0A4R7W819_9PSEU|nr:ABC transporter ATP-binding protein [Actinophytocola oryzae]TDV57837.1 NitT/TauT family transport system ATP-binding protein [Actinophytocola oryzae]
MVETKGSVEAPLDNSADPVSGDPDVHVRCSGVGKVFVSSRGATRALAGVDLVIERGTFVCLIGPSGCGKSTLLRIIGGLDTPSEGEVDVRGLDGRQPRPAFVFQEHGIFPWLTVRENVEFGLRMDGMRRTRRREVAREWIHRVGLEKFASHYPNQLSGGMRQRISIARAFAYDGDLMLMDEPLGALDAQTRALMQEQLLELWERNRTTVLLVTHSIEEALLLGDRVVTMTARPGRVKGEMRPGFARPRSMELEARADFAGMKAQLWGSLRDEAETTLLEGDR